MIIFALLLMLALFVITVALLPLGTDAPLYHLPFATAGIILANLLAFLVTAGNEQLYRWCALWLGAGIQPTQWLTSIYMHMGWMHLITNMLALWAFGLVVEGKVGSVWMLIIYHAVGITESAIDQILALFFLNVPAEAMHVFGVAAIPVVGASAAVFGLMAMALVWAPANHIICPASLATGAEVPLVGFVFFYLATNFLGVWLNGVNFSSELFHLLGALFGGIIGVTMFKKGLVDCEGFDIFAMVMGREGSAAHQPAPYKNQKRIAEEQRQTQWRAQQQEMRQREGWQRFQDYLAAGHIDAALAKFKALKKHDPQLQLPQTDLECMIRSYQLDRQWNKLVPLLEERINRFPESANAARLLLAKILVICEKRPRAALKLLRDIDARRLNGHGREVHKKIVRTAEKLISEGEMEIGD